METYRVTPKRWERGWELHIEGVGVTQCSELGEAEDVARDYVAELLSVPLDGFTVVVLPAPG